MGPLGIAQLVVTILSGLPALIKAVESVFGLVKGKGSVKKDAVLAVTKVALDTAALTGNDAAARPEVQKEILELTGKTTDALVGTFNALSEWHVQPIAPAAGSDK